MLPRLPVLLVVLFAFPAASATWFAHGSHEPDTIDDAQGGFMWSDPPPSGVQNRIYFNAFTTQSYLFVNPNVGTLHTRFETVATEYLEAILGVWSDCNQDGHVGLAETAMREYPSALLLDDGVCAPRTGSPSSWSQGQFNYNGWVTEFIPIGLEMVSQGDDRVIRDLDARVWGDVGGPGGVDGPSCVFYELPAGGARSTGRILDHLDCYLTMMAHEQSADAYHDLTDGPLAASEDVLGQPTGLRTDDERWSGEAHPAEQETLGDENAPSYVTVFDCDRWQPTFLTRDEPPGDDFDQLYLEPVGTPRPHEDGSLAGTYLHYSRAIAQDQHDGQSPCWTAEWRNEAETYGMLEGEGYDVFGSVKDAASWNFRWHPQARGSGPGMLLGAPGAGAGLLPGGDAGAAPDAGVDALSNACRQVHCAPSRWYADSLTARKLPVLARVDARVDAGELPVGLPESHVMTFYANVGPATFSRGFVTPGGSGVYGSVACGSFTSGVHNGWQCDPSLWNPYTHEAWRVARVGQSYDLRDVDCYDGNTFLGIAAGLAALGERPCVGP